MTDVEIRYDTDDITDLCVIAETMFTSRANGTPGDCTIVIKDVTQTQFFTMGKSLQLYLDGSREWDGYLVTKERTYWFDGHTANCSPCPHLTPRRIVLKGMDRNSLFTRRVLFDPTDPTKTDAIRPAGTSDQDLIADWVNLYVNPHDGIDYATKVDEVQSPDPYAEIDMPGPSHLWGEFMRELSQATGAVFYIDPDRYMIYTDVNTPTAPFVITDRPGPGEVGCRDLTILHRADEMINDALVWGAGQGLDHIAFARTQANTSIAVHNRWQNTNGYHPEMFRQETVQRVADSIIYGSPEGKRGHKDNAVSVDLTIFEPGIRVGHKVDFRSDVFDFTDVIPVRALEISFPAGPTNVQYKMHLSHELDEPWTTVEYWRPRDRPEEEDPPPTGPPPGPTLNCNIPLFGISTSLNTSSGPTNPTIRPSHRSGHGSIVWGVKIELGINVWFWLNDAPYEWHSSVNPNSSLFTSYTHSYLDEVVYSGLFDFDPVRMHDPGEEAWSWYTDYRLFHAPANTQWPGLGINCHLEGTLTFIAKTNPRVRIGNANDADPNFPNTKPHVVQIIFTRPGIIVEDGLTQYKPVRILASALVEGTMMDGDSVPVTLNFSVADLQYFYLAPVILEAELDDNPIAYARLEFDHGLIEYRNRLPQGYIGLPGCVEIPISGHSCFDAIHDHGVKYRVPVAYVLGTLEVSVDGLQLRRNEDFFETSSTQGTFELLRETESAVYVCLDAAGTHADVQLPSISELFQIPCPGARISGTFGAQTALWDELVWHGTYYEHFHNGVDFGVTEGTAVYAAADGETLWEDQFAGGTMIHIYHDNGMRTTYAHLSSRVVGSGVSVTQGQLIAYSGATGDVTGAHLHWGMVYAGSPEDPIPYSNYTLAVPSF